jgi:hypothetical protein
MRRAALVLAGVIALVAPDQPGHTPAACASTRHHAFDFWAGDWDVFEVAVPQTRVARARVRVILDGCTLHEVYEGSNGLTGQSFSAYDATRGMWQQSWFTNRGDVLLLEGGMQGNRMVLIGTQRDASGAAKLIRGEWQRGARGVRETATTSLDSGKTWQPLFDLEFRAARPGLGNDANRFEDRLQLQPPVEPPRPPASLRRGPAHHSPWLGSRSGL